MDTSGIDFFFKNGKTTDMDDQLSFTCYSRECPENAKSLKMKLESQSYFKFEQAMDKKLVKEILAGGGLKEMSDFMINGIFKKSSFSMPEIMAILNFTPDSFYATSRVKDGAQIKNAIESGCQILDIGAESTRPGAIETSPDEEIRRLASAFESIDRRDGYKISLDSRHYRTVNSFIGEIDIINDISGMEDLKLPEAARDEGKSYVLMHIKGNPTNMNKMATYDDLFGEMAKFFFEKLKTLNLLGLKPEKIIIDPGLGFSKKGVQNLEIVRNPGAFNFGFRRLFGHSRKSFLNLNSKNKPEERLPETLSVSLHLATEGVEILRVHDPVENINALRFFQKLRVH